MMTDLFKRLSEAVIAGEGEAIAELTLQALEGGTHALDLLEKGLLPGMEVVGQRFKAGEMFVPEVLISAEAMRIAMDILRPLLSASDAPSNGTVVIGTVEGDIHDVGKFLVAMMLEGAGFKVVDLGTDIKPQAFVQAAKDYVADIVAMSSMLTTTMPKMGQTIEALRDAGIRERVKVMAGGAPVTQRFVEKIGADAYGSNATAAVEKAKALLRR